METPEQLKEYVSTGFGADAPDGPRAFVVAQYPPCPSGNVPTIGCDTSDFMRAIGLDYNDDEDWDILENMVLGGARPDVIAAIIQQVNTK